MFKRSARAGLIALTASTALVLAACGSSSGTAAPGGSSSGSQAPSVGSLTVATAANVHELVRLGLKHGSFAAEGLDLKEINTSTQTAAFAAIAGGSADAGYNTGISVLTAGQTGQLKASIIGAVKDGALYLAISKKYATAKGITSSTPADEVVTKLQGSKFGVVNPASAQAALPKILFKNYGLDPVKSFSFVATGDSTADLPSLSAGRIDAVQTNSETAFKAQDELGGVIFPVSYFTKVPQFHDQMGRAIIVSESAMKAKPEAVKAFLRGLYKTWDWLKSNPVEAKKALSEIYPTSPSGVVSAVYDSQVLGLYVTQKSWNASKEIFEITGGKPSTMEYSTYVSSFQDDVLASLKLTNPVEKS